MLSLGEDEDRVQRRLNLSPEGEPASFTELEIPLATGDELAYRWAADDRVGFNVHAHRERAVDFFVEEEGTEGEGTFTAPRDGTFYLMWQNRQPRPVRVRVEAERAA